MPVDPSPLRAVIFDLDGTLADTERDGHRVAFNAAFERMGLPDRWDQYLYGELLRVAGGKERLRHYFTTYRPLPDDERDRIVPLLHALKNRTFMDLLRRGVVRARPGAPALIRAIQRRGVATAVATGGSRVWVEPLLDTLLGPPMRRMLRAVVTGDDVSRAKPDPEIYLRALARLGCDGAAALAVEDAETGVLSARAAGIGWVVGVVNDYTADQDLSAADLVVDSFGAPGRPAQVLSNPHGVRLEDSLDVPALDAVVAVASGNRLGSASAQPVGRA
jgi:HAD superfamily hydrolase (TIGR01509 family)